MENMIKNLKQLLKSISIILLEKMRRNNWVFLRRQVNSNNTILQPQYCFCTVKQNGMQR